MSESLVAILKMMALAGVITAVCYVLPGRRSSECVKIASSIALFGKCQ